MDQVVESPQRLVDWDVRARAVDLVQINVIHLEAPQRSLALLDNVSPVVARGVWIFLIHRPVHLGREHDGVALAIPLQRLPYGLLAGASAVDVRRVEEVDTLVDGAVDDIRRVLFTRPSSEHHAPQADLADLHAGSSEVPVLHDSLLRGSGSHFLHTTAASAQTPAV